MRVPLTSLIAVLAVAMPLVAQEKETRFGVAGGLNFVGGGASKIGVDIAGTQVAGADRGGQFVAAFLEHRRAGSLIGLRLEGFYSGLSSGPKTVSAGIGRSALRDNTFGVAATMSYALRNGPGLTPYVLLGAGIYASSLGTNPDANASEVTQTRNAMGLGAHVGAGLQWNVGKRQMFAELRFHQALHQARGAAFMPLVVGLKF
jgi:opacity protein-like surface antigen